MPFRGCDVDGNYFKHAVGFPAHDITEKKRSPNTRYRILRKTNNDGHHGWLPWTPLFATPPAAASSPRPPPVFATPPSAASSSGRPVTAATDGRAVDVRQQFPGYFFCGRAETDGAFVDAPALRQAVVGNICVRIKTNDSSALIANCTTMVYPTYNTIVNLQK